MLHISTASDGVVPTSPSAHDISKWVLTALVFGLFAACSTQESLPAGQLDDSVGQRAIDAGFIRPRGDSARSIENRSEDAGEPYDAGPGWSYGTCTELYACAQASCGTSATQGCESGCVGKAKDTAASEIALYVGCMDDVCRAVVCKDDKSVTCMAACSAQRCSPLLLPCLSAKKSGSNGCAVIFGAEDGCAKAQDAFKCLAASYDTLAPAQQSAWLAMRQCLAASTAVDRWGDCLDTVVACTSNGKIGPGGCHDVMACEAGCGAAAHLYSCIGKCAAGAGKLAQIAYTGLRKCLAAIDAKQPTGGDCLAEALDECAPGKGTATCSQTAKCVSKCKATNGWQEVNCATGCMAAATTSSAKKYSTWIACRDGVCQPKCGPDKSCLNSCYASQCGVASAACLGS